MYAGASGDFNPMHHDEVAAQAAGLPSVFGHGMFTAGPARDRASPTTSASATSRRTGCASRSRPGPARRCTTTSRSTREAARQRDRARVRARERERRGEDPGRGRRRAAGATADRWPACASTSRRPTSRPSRSGTAAAKGSSSSGTATRAARTTSTRGRSARSAGATTSSGRRRRAAATLYTYSIVHQNDLPPFNERVPYVAAVVELEEGPRVMTNIEGAPFDELRVGMPVVVDFKPLDDEITIADLPRRALTGRSDRERRRAGLELPVRRAAARGVPAAARRAERVDVADRLARRRPTARRTSSSAWS